MDPFLESISLLKLMSPWDVYYNQIITHNFYKWSSFKKI